MAATVTEENGKFYLNFNGNKFSYNSRDKAEAAAFQLNTGAEANIRKGGSTTRYNQGEGTIDSTTGSTVSSASTTSSPASTSSTVNTTSGSSYISTEQQQKKYGYSMDSSDIGQATRVTMDEEDIQPMGSFPDIKATGNYVIVDVLRNGRVLRQTIYGPNGRSIKSINPDIPIDATTGRPVDNPWYQRDVTQALIEVQMERHGNQQQVIQAKQQKFNRELARANSISTAKFDPSIVNRVISSSAKDLAAAKLGIDYSDFNYLESNLISEANRKLDYVQIARADNGIAAMTTQAAYIYTQTNNTSNYQTATGGDRVGAPSGAPQVKASNGYSLVYFGDPEADPESPLFNRESVVGRIGLMTADNVLLKWIGAPGTPSGGTQRRIASIMSKATGRDLSVSEAQLALFGVGALNPEEVKSTFGNLPMLRTTGYEEEGYVDPITGRRPVLDTRQERQTEIVNNIAKWTGSELYQPEKYGNFTDYMQYQPGGRLYSQTQAALTEYQNKLNAEVAAERAGRQTYTGATTTAPTTTGTTPTTETTTPTYETTTPGVTTTPTDESGTPVAVSPTTPTPGTTYPQQPVTGTFPSPTQTGGLGAVPGEVPGMPSGVAGYDVNALTGTMPGVGVSNVGVRTVMYSNQFGQTIPVTESNGQPITYVPPGYSKTSGAAKGGMMRKGYAEGGLVEAEKSMAAKFLGFKGGDLEKFLEANPAAAAKMGKYRTALRNKMTQKGTMFAQEGTFVSTAESLSSIDPYQEELATQQREAIKQTMQPMQAPVQTIAPTAADFIPTTAGQASVAAPMAQVATIGAVEQAGMPVMAPAGMMQPTAVTPQVQQVTAATQAAKGQVSQQAQVEAAQQVGTSISGIDAAQGNAILMDNPVQRQIQEGELISGVANAETASAFTEQVQAATATPSNKATVAGQLETLMADFEGGETPVWAAGSMRTAMQTLSARGLGASSLAGQAVIQAAMEAALPIAQMDAQTQAQFEAQNLSNRQQRAMLAAQQRATFLGQEFDQAYQARVQNSARIGDIANMNFTSEQQIALENSRAANTINLNNLSNRQAMVMAEAAALSQLDMSNLNNRQQAAVQNAQNFLQMDMANLSNEQQTAMFKAQQNIQAMFTDQAAENAAAQFNATSENQTNQFFANLTAQTSQFNASQRNAMDQFNVNSTNALREFNAELQQQRDLFNAQNGLVIAQSNAQWRQNIATLNTAALNQSNADFARTINGLTENNMTQIWQRERDIMSFAFQTANNNADRATSIAVENLRTEATKEAAEGQKSAGFAKAAGALIGEIITG